MITVRQLHMKNLAKHEPQNGSPEHFDFMDGLMDTGTDDALNIPMDSVD